MGHHLRTMIRALWLLVGWGLTVVTVFGLYLRWSEATSTFRIGLVGLLPLLLLVPLLGLALTSWLIRSSYLRLAALATGIVYLATFFSFGSVIGCGPRSAEDAIVIYSHNVRFDAGDSGAIAAAITAADADIVVLQEVSPSFREQINQDPNLAQYPHRASEIVGAPAGIALWSRWPLTEPNLSYVARRPILEAMVNGPTGPFRVRGIHLASPVSDFDIPLWTEGLQDLGSYQIEGPTIVAGDFNSTADHSQFRTVINQGWTDVHRPKGCGFDATWPADGVVPFAVLRLDHVLVSPHFEVLSVDIGAANGSDHRPVITSVRLIPGTAQA